MDQGGNNWTLFTPGIWKVLHAVLQMMMIEEAFSMGFNAGQKDATSDTTTANPFTRGSLEHGDWAVGYKCGMKMARKIL